MAAIPWKTPDHETIKRAASHLPLLISGLMPFVAMDVLRVALLTAFPGLVLLLT